MFSTFHLNSVTLDVIFYGNNTESCNLEELMKGKGEGYL